MWGSATLPVLDHVAAFGTMDHDTLLDQVLELDLGDHFVEVSI